MSEEPGGDSDTPTTSTTCLDVVCVEPSTTTTTPTLTVPEDDDDCFEGIGNLTEGVLELLNSRVVAREPKDPGYKPASFFPTEASIYAAEYCKLQDKINILSQKLNELEQLRESGAQESSSRNDMDLMKVELEKLTIENTEQKNKLVEAENRTKELISEAEVMKMQVVERGTELEKATTDLRTAECKLKNEEEESRKQQETIKNKEVLEAHHLNVISDLKEENEQFKEKSLRCQGELETCQLENSQYSIEIKNSNAENNRLTKELMESQEAIINLKRDLELEASKCNKLSKDVDEWQQKTNAVEGKMEELRQKVEKDAETYQQALDEKLHSNENLNQKVVALEDTISKQLDELNRGVLKCDKLRDDLSVCKERKEELEELLEKTKEKFAENVQQEKSRLTESYQVKESLNQKVKTLEGILSVKQEELKQSKEQEETEREAKYKITTKHEKLRSLVSSLSSEMLMFLQLQSPSSTASVENSMSPETRLKLLSEVTTSKFLLCLEERSLARSELTKIQNLMTYLDNILKSKSVKPSSIAETLTQKQQKAVHYQTPSPVIVASTPPPRSTLHPMLPSAPLAALAAPTSITSSRLSYRDMLLRSVQKAPTLVQPLKVPVSRPLFFFSPNVYRSSETPSTPTSHISSPVTSRPPVQAQPTSNLASSVLTNNNVSNKDTDRKSKTEVRQLFTDSQLSTSNEERQAKSKPNATHGIDKSKSHQGFYCLCGCKNSTLMNLKVHINYFTTKTKWKFRCSLCNKRFYYLTYLNRHLKVTHKVNICPTKNGWRGCRECGKSFPSHKKLMLHRKSVHTIRRSKLIVSSRSETSSGSVRSLPKSVADLNIPASSSPLKKILLKNTKTRSRSHWNIVNGVTSTSTLFESAIEDTQTEESFVSSTNGPNSVHIENANVESDNLHRRIVLAGRHHQERAGKDNLFSEIMTSIETSVGSTEAEIPPKTATTSVFGGGTSSPHAVDKENADHGNFCICGKQSPNKAALNKHIDHYNPRCHFSCFDCKLRFVGTNMLRKHMKIKHNKVYPYRGCRKCGMTFRNMLELKRHQKLNCSGRHLAIGLIEDSMPVQNLTTVQHSPGRVYEFSEESDENIVTSMPSMLSDNPKKHGQDVTREDEGIFCYCGAKFPTQGKLTMHVDQNTEYSEDRKFQCTHCLKRFKVHGELSRHRRRVHKIKNLKKRSHFGCQSCGRVFKAFAKLMQHRRISHSGSMKPKGLVRKINTVQSFKTRKIGRIVPKSKIPMSSALSSATVKLEKITVKAHTEDWAKIRQGKFVCSCGHKAKDKYCLQKHIRYFTDKKQFQCPYCEVKFATTYRLSKHVRQKHGNGASRSSSSAKGTAVVVARKETAANLSVTNKKHGVDMAKRSLGFYCVCGTKCGDKGKLNHHIQYLNLERKFVCEICSKRFAYLSLLNRHARNTHKLDGATKGHNLRGCSECGSCFSSFQELCDHRKSAHSAAKNTQQRIKSKSSNCLATATANVLKSTRELPLRAVNRVQIPKSSPNSSTVHQSHNMEQNVPTDILEDTPSLASTLSAAQEHSAPIAPNSGQDSPTNNANDKVAVVDHTMDRNKAHLGHFCKCGLKLKSRVHLEYHTQYFLNRKKFLCGLCSKTYSQVSSLNKHKRQYHHVTDKIAAHGCRSCGVIFTSKRELAEHWVKIFSPTRKLVNVSCPLKRLITSCDTSGDSGIRISRQTPLPTEADLTIDEEVDGVNDWITVTPSISIRIGPSSIKDPLGGLSFSDPLTESVSITPSEQELSLPEGNCSSNASSSAHGIITANSDLALFICKCGKQLSNKHTLNKHIRRFTAERKFICQMCGKAFLVASLLRGHLLRAHKIVQSTGSIGCTECGEFFPNNMELHYHHKIVHNHGYCDMKYTPATPMTTFSASQELSQELPIELSTDTAEDVTTIASSTAAHQPVATDPLSEGSDSGYPCSCGKVYLSRNSLSHHIRVQKRGKIFQCSWCSLSFNTHWNLKSHVRVIHNVDYVAQKGKFACGICAQTFYSYEEVKKHRLGGHGNLSGEKNKNSDQLSLWSKFCGIEKGASADGIIEERMQGDEI